MEAGRSQRDLLKENLSQTCAGVSGCGTRSLADVTPVAVTPSRRDRLRGFTPRKLWTPCPRAAFGWHLSVKTSKECRSGDFIREFQRSSRVRVHGNCRGKSFDPQLECVLPPSEQSAFSAFAVGTSPASPTTSDHHAYWPCGLPSRSKRPRTQS